MDASDNGQQLYRMVCEERGKEHLSDEEVGRIAGYIKANLDMRGQENFKIWLLGKLDEWDNTQLPALVSDNAVRNFRYEAKTIRVVALEDGPWWVLADVCCALGLTTPAKVAERLDEDERGMSLIHTPGGPQKMRIINESGLYNVILRSDKPEAKPFKRWVTHEVLPAIRETGAYGVNLEALKSELEKQTEQERIRIKAECYDIIRNILQL